MDLYWLTRLDVAHTVAGWSILALLIVIFCGLVVAGDEKESWEKEDRKFMRKLVIALIVMSLFRTFVPTSKETAIIKELPETVIENL